MATNFINNLSNTYRQSPSLQNQFATEQDYIDLFDNNKVTPAMAQAYVPVDDTTGIKSITNTAPTIINETGGDGDNNIGGPGYGYTGPGSTVSETGFNIDDIGEGTIDSVDNIGTGITAKGLMAALSFAMNPIGFFVGRYAKDRYKAYKEKKAAEEAAAEQAALDKAYADQMAAQGSTTGSYDTGGRFDGAKDKASYDRDPTGFSGSSRDGGIMGYGGKSGTPRYQQYFNGGIVSLRRR